nr:MAG TPA: hypothetical protein [Caudoviricetes sp.]DAM37512.1 MAG TPA: hypothetical protein [Caudoviricetes sp.]
MSECKVLKNFVYFSVKFILTQKTRTDRVRVICSRFKFYS